MLKSQHSEHVRSPAGICAGETWALLGRVINYAFLERKRREVGQTNPLLTPSFVAHHGPQVPLPLPNATEAGWSELIHLEDQVLAVSAMFGMFQVLRSFCIKHIVGTYELNSHTLCENEHKYNHSLHHRTIVGI